MRTRVLLADDHAILRDGLRLLLKQRGYRVVAEARDGAAAVRRARRQRPDFAVLEIALPEIDGIRTAREIKRVSPRTHVILLTALRDENLILHALREGVRGFVLKSQPADDLLRAMQEVRRGGIYVSPEVSGAVLRTLRGAPALAREPITQREREVLALVAEGRTTKEIAALLRISVKTVGFHRGRVMKKLDIHGTAGLVRYAIRQGLVPP